MDCFVLCQSGQPTRGRRSPLLIPELKWNDITFQFSFSFRICFFCLYSISNSSCNCGTESQSVECMKIENGGQGTVSSIWVHRLIFSWLLSLAIWALLLLGLFTSFDREADFKLSYVLHPLRNHCSASVLSIRSSTAMYRVQSRAPHPLEYSDVWSSSLEVSRSLSPFYKIAQYKVMLWKSSSRLSKRTRAISWSSRCVNIGSNPPQNNFGLICHLRVCHLPGQWFSIVCILVVLTIFLTQWCQVSKNKNKKY